MSLVKVVEFVVVDIQTFPIYAGSQASSRLHSHSLDLLASHFKRLATGTGVEGNKVESLTVAQLQEALPTLVVGLANPVQVCGLLAETFLLYYLRVILSE